MYDKEILLIFISLFILINGQFADDQDLPSGRRPTGRTSKVSFDEQFPRGLCPYLFYQLDDECLFFATDGKIYSWQQAERVCSRRIGRVVNQESPATAEQPNMKPTKGVRQLTLNTPKKTEILRALFRDYNEQNFAVRLPPDYNTLERCHDGKDDKLPEFCESSQSLNATCFETISNGPNNNCLREVTCNSKYLRLACEFTLPGSAELTSSTFRQCPISSHRHRHGLPRWAWIAIIVCSVLILLAILVGIFGYLRKSKKSKKSLPEPRQPEKGLIKREDPDVEPMINRAAPINVADTSYLEPQPSNTDNTANA